MYLLIIKGTVKEAKKAAEKNNVVLAEFKSKAFNETYAKTEASLEEIGEWYAKPKVEVKGFGYAVGTLLYYKEVSQRIMLERESS